MQAVTQRTDAASQRADGGLDGMASVTVAIACASADAFSGLAKAKLLESAARGRGKSYRLTEDAADAELVLVIAKSENDPLMRTVLQSPVYERCGDKCVVVSEADNPAPILPGIYAGIPSRWVTPGWAAAGPYIEKLRPSELENDGLDVPIEYLYSFAGSVYTHPVRERVMKLDDGRALLRDTGDKKTSQHLTFTASEEARLERRRSYDLSLAQSAVVLCPRGVAPASVRFFETLRAGRVPVVISDDWQLPTGPDWERFVVRVPESRVAEIPARLRELESEAYERGRLARAAWDAWFAADVLFERLVEQALKLQQERGDKHLASRIWRRRLLLTPTHVRAALRLLRNRTPRSTRGEA